METKKEIALDEKKIIIPKEFGIEPETIIYPVLDPRYPDVAFLYPEAAFEELAEGFMAKLQKDLRDNKITQKEYNELLRKFVAECSFSDEELDEMRSIFLDDLIISKLKLVDNALVVLEDNKIVLCKDEETYNEYSKTKIK